MLNQFYNRQRTFEPSDEFLAKIASVWEYYIEPAGYFEGINLSLKELNTKTQMLLLQSTPKEKELYELIYLWFMWSYELHTPPNQRFSGFREYPRDYFKRIANQYNVSDPEQRQRNKIKWFRYFLKDIFGNCPIQTLPVILEEPAKQLQHKIMEDPKLVAIVKQFTPELSKHMEAQAATILKGFKTMNVATKIDFLIRYAAAKGVVIASQPTQEKENLNTADDSVHKKESRPSLSK